MSRLLEVAGLGIELPGAAGMTRVVGDATFAIAHGEAVGLVGESGSGKSMTARAIMRLLPAGASVAGRITFDGVSVLGMGRSELRAFRARRVAMIFQDPRAHTNPVRTVGDFLTEAMRTNLGMRRADATAKAERLLAEVGIAEPARLLRRYPHQLSGGMLQRVMIAAALAPEPRLLLADEPTTALDVTTQAEVMAILDALRRDRGLAMLFITHDLELAAATCDRTLVMYAGSLVEEQASARLHARPLHPYTAGLLRARPSVTETARRLADLPGRPLAASEAPAGCAFAARCAHAEAACRQERPEMRGMLGGRVACRRAEELLGAAEASS